MPYQSIYQGGLFANKVIIVTGGGSGIGRCTAHELASLGAHVAIVGRTEQKLRGVCAEITEDGGSATYAVCDVREEAKVIETIDTVLSEHGRIDGLVNNAGGQYRSDLKSISTKGFEAVVRSNLVGGFIFMREVYNRWMEANGGAIVNMVSDMWHGMPTYGHSGAARSGMVNLTESAAAEWAWAGVRVNAVAPGVVASSGFDTYPEEVFASIRSIAAKTPMGRVGNEAEVAAAITFLLSPGASFITGVCLRIDGGAPNARQTIDLRPPERGSPPFGGFHRAKPTRQ